jgi:predicted Rossmann fold flavoprotein
MFQDQYDIVIIGAGAAGLIAAIESYTPSKKIIILEKMPKAALKLKISGKGRCNITNDASLNDFLAHFGKNGRFLKYAFSEFFNSDLLAYFDNLGVQFKLERGGRYFPLHDNAAEIVNSLTAKIKSLRIPLATYSEVIDIKKPTENNFIIIINQKKDTGEKNMQPRQIKADKILLATGGKSYPGTGSSGTGYTLAARLGHTITPLSPSLVPLDTAGKVAKQLQGLSLKNVAAKIWCYNKKIEEQFGEMLFTDSGLSGPIILSLSKTVIKLINEKQKVVISIDLKPALDHKMLDRRLLKEISEHSKKTFNSLLKRVLPRKMIPVFIEKLKIPGEKQLSQINAQERRKLLALLKDFQLEVTAYRSFDQAIITSGGVRINEINPQTMESKLIKNLYFAGEIIDIDADTGGFNLQAAFSTGWVAGRAMKYSDV